MRVTRAEVTCAEIAVCILLSSCLCLSQPDGDLIERNTMWVNIGGGVGLLSPVKGFCWKVSVSVDRNRHVFSGRVSRFTELNSDLVEPRSPRPEEVETDYAVLYGRDLSSKGEYFVVSVGLSYVRSQHRGATVDEAPFGLVHETISIGSIGLAIDAQMFFPLTKFNGLGVSFVGNVNATRSFGGVLIALIIGSFE
jgi:hypothetical protein